MNTDFFSFKKLFISYLFAMIPFSLLTGVLSLFNILPVDFNGKPTYGFAGLALSILACPFIALIFSCANWLFLNFGILLSKLFLKKN